VWKKWWDKNWLDFQHKEKRNDTFLIVKGKHMNGNPQDIQKLKKKREEA